MNYPVFIFRELALSLSLIRPEIGDYDSIVVNDDVFMIRTTNGQLSVDGDTISKQYQDPKLISRQDLEHLAQSFRWLEKPKLSFG
ncbi:MAG: hypothetical protein V4594_24000 [Bacteroidota bacterium]